MKALRILVYLLCVLLAATTAALAQQGSQPPAGTLNIGQGLGALPSWKSVAGDCTLIAAGSIVCTKSGGVSFGTMAFQNASAVSISGGTITSATVTGLASPTNASDAAPKSYVDSVASGLNVLGQTRLATAAVLPNSPTYSNGTAGVGATLTAGSNTTLTVDGTTANLNDVVLVKNQASTVQNGQYYVSTAGSGGAAWVLTRCTAAACGVQFNTSGTMIKGSYTFVTAGSTNNSNSYSLAATVTTVGTDPATFVLFSTVPALWVISGPNVYYSAGSVGIGSSTTPSSALQVFGTLTVGTSVGTPGAGQLVPSAAAAVSMRQTFGTDGSGYNYTIAKDVAGTKTDMFYLNDTGNAALGTTPGSARLTVSAPSSANGVSVTQTTACCGPDGAGITGSTAANSFGLYNTSSGGKNWRLISYGAGSGLAGYFGIYNDTLGNLVAVDGTGNVGIGTTAPAFDGNSSKFLAVNNPTAHGQAEFGVGGNATSIGDFAGGISFYNSSLGTTEKRLAVISSGTNGALNTGQMNFGVFNAGSFVTNLTLMPWQQTNIRGSFGINIEAQSGTDITSALQTALNTYLDVRLPCGTFTISSIPISLVVANQKIEGCSREGTILQSTSSATNYMFDVNQVNGITIKGLTVDMQSLGLTGCVNLRGGARTSILNFGCKNAPNAGIQVASFNNTVGSHDSILNDLYFENVGLNTVNGHTIECSFSNRVAMSNIVMENVDNGVNISECQQGSLTNFVVHGSGTTLTSFPGVRITNGSNNWGVSGGSIFGTPRGIIIAAGNFSTISSVSISNVQYEAIYIQSSLNVPCGADCYPAQGSVLSDISIHQPCLIRSSCKVILIEDTSGGNTATNNVIYGIDLIDSVGNVATLFGLNGQAAGTNRCDNSVTTLSNRPYGSC